MSLSPRRRLSMSSPRRTIRPSSSMPTRFDNNKDTEIYNNINYDEQSNDALKSLTDSKGQPRRGTRRCVSNVDDRHEVTNPDSNNNNNNNNNNTNSEKKMNHQHRRHYPSRSKSHDTLSTFRASLCKDQVKSIRNLIAETVTNEKSDHPEWKKRIQKKKEQEIKEQMDKRTMLNLQFTSIRKLLQDNDYYQNETTPLKQDDCPSFEKQQQHKPAAALKEKCNKIQSESSSSMNETTMHFDPFHFDCSVHHSSLLLSSSPKCFKNLNREVSFRDVLTRNRLGEISFRDLTKENQHHNTHCTTSSTSKYPPPTHTRTLQDHIQKPLKFAGIQEDPFATMDNDEITNFESIFWGATAPKKRQQQQKGRDEFMEPNRSNRNCPPIQEVGKNNNNNNNTDLFFNIQSNEENGKVCPSTKPMFHRTNTYPESTTIIKACDTTKSRRRNSSCSSNVHSVTTTESSGTCSSHVNSINTDTSQKSKTSAPSKKKKKTPTKNLMNNIDKDDLKDSSIYTSSTTGSKTNSRLVRSGNTSQTFNTEKSKNTVDVEFNNNSNEDSFEFDEEYVVQSVQKKKESKGVGPTKSSKTNSSGTTSSNMKSKSNSNNNMIISNVNNFDFDPQQTPCVHDFDVILKGTSSNECFHKSFSKLLDESKSRLRMMNNADDNNNNNNNNSSNNKGKTKNNNTKVNGIPSTRLDESYNSNMTTVDENKYTHTIYETENFIFVE